MNEEVSQQALRLLEELVLDAGEAVSYRRLAAALCLHVNRSKALLQEFVEKYEVARGLKTCVLVCGATGNGGARVMLSSRDELESVRASLNPVLFEHIYAVSCSSVALGELALTAAAGAFDDLTPTIGAISNDVCAKRSQEEIGSLKTNSYEALANNNATLDNDTSRSTVKNNLNFTVKTEEKDLSDAVTIPVTDPISLKKCTETTSASAVKKDVKSSVKSTGKGNISNFFSKSNGLLAAKQTLKVEEKSIETKATSQGVVKRSSNAINKIEAKDEDIKIEETPEKKRKNLTSDKTEKEVAKKKEPTKVGKTEKEVAKKKEPTKVGKTVKNEASTKKETVRAHKNTKVEKKRKRVICLSDSEDSEEEKDDPFEEPSIACPAVESDDEVIPPTPNADVVKITSGIVNPKKRRRIIDKTYTTEDGYMVTRKEEVLESCSEDEVDVKENVEMNVKKEIVIENKTPAVIPKTKKKMPSPQKGKQASIMSFFKKKP